MTNSHLVSIIIPNYNSEKYISETLDCIFHQREVSPFEIIVVDDGSTDNSINIIKEYAAKYPQIILIEQANQGPYPARNNALAHAKGEFICFLDADDFWDESFLSTMLAAICNSNADLVYCGWQNIGENGPGSEPYIPPLYQVGNLAYDFLKGCPWPIHAAMVKKSLIDEVHGFSERDFSSMDYDLWLRLSVVIKKIERVAKVLAYYRWHDEGQISSNKWPQVINAWKTKKEFVSNHARLFSTLDRKNLNELINKPMKNIAFACYWKDDFQSSWHLFRKLIFLGEFFIKDLKYMLPALLPKVIYIKLMRSIRNGF